MSHQQNDEEPFYFSQRARFVDQLSFAAVGSAVSMSRHFIGLTLDRWYVRSIKGDATLVVSELVTNAVKVTGVLDRRPTWAELENLDLVTVRLVGLDTSLVIEVWDTSKEMPVLQKPGDATEGGRGLLLVQEMTKRWGSCRTPLGKLVWAEIAVPEAAPATPPHRRTSELPGRRRAGADSWLLRRVLVGLQAM